MRQMRLQFEGSPDAMNKVPWDAQFLRQTAYAPVRCLLGPLVQRGIQDLLHLVIAVTSRLTASRRIGQSAQTLTSKSTPPTCLRSAGLSMTFGNLFTGESGRTIQHDSSTNVQPRTPGAPSTQC